MKKIKEYCEDSNLGTIIYPTIFNKSLDKLIRKVAEDMQEECFKIANQRHLRTKESGEMEDIFSIKVREAHLIKDKIRSIKIK